MSVEGNISTQLSQVISQATPPAFLLAAVGSFTSVLVTRLNRTVDRVRALQGVAPHDDGLAPPPDVANLRRRAKILNRAILFGLASAMTLTILVLLGFIAAMGSFPNEIYAGSLFILACAQFTISLWYLAFEIRISLPPQEFDQ